MRFVLKALMAVSPAVLILPAHALAASSDGAWRQSCSGAHYVCGSPVAESKAAKPQKQVAKLGNGDQPAKKVAKTTAVKQKQAAQSEDEPAPKAKPKAKAKAKVAAKTSSDDAPAPKAKKTKVAKKSSGGGGGASYSGYASWYGGQFHGRKTANGETYNQWALTAASKTLPFGTVVRVTNSRNGDYVDVRINDRGPYVGGRIIDLSHAAANEIGLTASGVAPVKVTVLGKG